MLISHINMGLEGIISQFCITEEDIISSPDSDEDWCVDWNWDRLDPNTNESAKLQAISTMTHSARYLGDKLRPYQLRTYFG